MKSKKPSVRAQRRTPGRAVRVRLPKTVHVVAFEGVTLTYKGPAFFGYRTAVYGMAMLLEELAQVDERRPRP